MKFSFEISMEIPGNMSHLHIYIDIDPVDSIYMYLQPRVDSVNITEISV